MNPARRHRVQDALRWFGRHEFGVLAVLTVIALCVFAFVNLTAYARGESTAVLDEKIILAMRVPGAPADPVGPAWLEEAGRDLTALGSTSVLALVVLGACCYLLLQRKRRIALFVALSVTGGAALSFLLKSGFDRPRPDLVAQHTEVFTSSFPSGHAMSSAVAYLTLGALLARSESNLRVKAFLLGAAAFLTLLVGTTRVYLGVHWPTDVLAGWAAGAAWALAMWGLARALQRRHGLEDGVTEADD